MKKLILAVLLTVTLSGGCYAADDYHYEREYLDSLKSCKPFSKTYTYSVKTKNPNSPYVKLQTKEVVVGRQGGNCVTKTEISSARLGEKLLDTQCSFTDKQLAELVSLMNATRVNAVAKQGLEAAMASHIQNGVCQVTRY